MLALVSLVVAFTTPPCRFCSYEEAPSLPDSATCCECVTYDITDQPCISHPELVSDREAAARCVNKYASATVDFGINPVPNDANTDPPVLSSDFTPGGCVQVSEDVRLPTAYADLGIRMMKAFNEGPACEANLGDMRRKVSLHNTMRGLNVFAAWPASRAETCTTLCWMTSLTRYCSWASILHSLLVHMENQNTTVSAWNLDGEQLYYNLSEVTPTCADQSRAVLDECDVTPEGVQKVRDVAGTMPDVGLSQAYLAAGVLRTCTPTTADQVLDQVLAAAARGPWTSGLIRQYPFSWAEGAPAADSTFCTLGLQALQLILTSTFMAVEDGRLEQWEQGTDILVQALASLKA